MKSHVEEMQDFIGTISLTEQFNMRVPYRHWGRA